MLLGLRGSVEIGQHAFPFFFQVSMNGCWCYSNHPNRLPSLQLPQGLPGSFEFKGHSESHGQIAYRLKARCRVKGMLKSDLRFFQFLSVAERLPANTVIQSQDITVTQVASITLEL